MYLVKGGVKGWDWLDHKKMETQRTISRVGRVGKKSNVISVRN
jgi:hypothetical protein